MASKSEPQRCEMATAKSSTRRKVKPTPAQKAFARWRKYPGLRTLREQPDDEFAIVKALILARTEAGLTQREIAERMNTTQSVIARLETHGAALKTLRRYAEVTGHRLCITLEPLPEDERAGKHER